MKNLNESELNLFLLTYSQNMQDTIIEFLKDQVDEPRLLLKHSIKTFLLYICSVAYREYCENIDKIVINIITQIGSDIDNIMGPDSNIMNEMLSAFKDYKKLENTYGLNSVNKIENKFSEYVYRYGKINTKGIFNILLDQLRNS